MVSCGDHVATGAGVAMLRAGGSAADAALAASAVLAVTWPQHCGPGGDLFALVHVPGEDEPAVLNASGRAGAGAEPERLREAGESEMPLHGDVRSVTVPGCVDGWMALHERYGRLALADVFEPARRLADGGFSACPQLAGAAGALPAGHELRAAEARRGAVVRRPGIARALEAIARDGRDGFYAGAFGDALLALGGGEFAADDLERPGADWVPALGLRVWGRQGWTVPPNSQGYLTLGSAWIAEGLELFEPGDARWAHGLIEAAAAARRDRDVLLHGEADGRALLAAPRLAEQRARIDPRQASDPVRLRGDGGTVGIAAVDPDGMGIALIQSNYDSWGSGLFAEGIALHNRGAAFSLAEGTLPEYGPGRRPPHTLSPLLVCRPDGSLHTVLATMGAAVAAADPAAAARAPAEGGRGARGCAGRRALDARRRRGRRRGARAERLVGGIARARPSRAAPTVVERRLRPRPPDRRRGRPSRRGGRPADRLRQRERVLGVRRRPGGSSAPAPGS